MNLFGSMLLLLITVFGIASAVSPLPTIGLAIIITLSTGLLVATRKANILTLTLACYGILVAIPALLPRPISDSQGTTTGGGLDTREIAQLAIFGMVLAFAIWLWLASDAGLAQLIRPPMSILTPYALVVCISLFYTPELGWPLFSFIKLLGPLSLMIVLSWEVTSADKLKRVIDAGLVGIVVVLGMFWFDILRGAASRSAGRYSTEWLHPNHSTLLAVTLLLVLIIRFLAAPGSVNRSHLFPLIGFASITAMMAASKSSLGAAALALVIGLLAMLIKKPTGSMMGRIILMSFGVFGIISYFFSKNLGIAAHLTNYERQDQGNLTGRVPIWNFAINETLESTMTTILGHGYLSTFSIGLESQYWTALQAHNSFIQTFFDLGLVGLVLVVALYLATWLKAAHALRIFSLDDPRWVRGLELFTVLAALTIVSFTEDIMGGTLESRQTIFLLVVFCIHQNLRVSRHDHLGDEDEEPDSTPGTYQGFQTHRI
jgi:O-antigen ligase